jgi:hypothetical protein
MLLKQLKFVLPIAGLIQVPTAGDHNRCYLLTLSGYRRRPQAPWHSSEAARPYLITFARIREIIQRTFGSSPLMTAVPESDSAFDISDFFSRVTSRDFSERLCSLPMEVTTTISGRSIHAYRAIGPFPLIPTSMTA